MMPEHLTENEKQIAKAYQEGYDEGYKIGYDEGFKIACNIRYEENMKEIISETNLDYYLKKIILEPKHNSGSFTEEELYKIFGFVVTRMTRYHYIADIFNKFTLKEIIENITKYENEKITEKFNEFHIGDEIENEFKERWLIIDIIPNKALKCVNIYNKLSSLVEESVTIIIYPNDLDNWKPTGKKFNTNINEI